MTFRADELAPELRAALCDDLIAIADTKLVLGNWYATCVMNGRSLPDFAGLLAMCQANYGHTRALYQYLVNYGYDYATLERGRGPGEIRSMNLLDRAPEDWEDFIAAAWLAEQASWMLLSGFLNHPDRSLAGLVEHVGQEAYFHIKYCDGWMRIIGEGKRERERFARHLKARYPLALQWFGPDRGADSLHKAGQRNVTPAKLKQGFAKEIAKGADLAQAKLAAAKTAAPPKSWRPDARRVGPLPEGLFEVVRFKDPGLAH